MADKTKRMDWLFETVVDGKTDWNRRLVGDLTGKAKVVFTETKNEFLVDLTGIEGLDFSSLPVIAKQGLLHGMKQMAGDKGAVGSDGTPEDVEEGVTAKLEMFLAGNFYAEREKGEARPSMVAEAVWEYKRENAQIRNREVDGKTVEYSVRKDGTEETLADVVARYAGKDGAAARKAALAEPKVKVILARLRREAQERREAAAIKAATEAKTTVAAEEL